MTMKYAHILVLSILLLSCLNILFNSHSIETTSISILVAITLMIFTVSSTKLYLDGVYYSFIIIFVFLLGLFHYKLSHLPIREYLIATKVLFIVALIGILPPRNNSEYKYLNIIILSIFFAAYIIDPHRRPYIFVENNFEIVLPILVALPSVLKQRKNINDYLCVFLIIAITLLSKSLVGIGCLGSVFIIRYLHLKFWSLLSVFFILVVLLVTATIIFLQRGVDINSIDRILFYEAATLHLKSATQIQLLFGSLYNGPLNEVSCQLLRSYSNMILEDGSCYSRILHAFNLRILVDYGICGTLLLFILLILGITRSLNNFRFGLAVFVVGFVNGMSVSGFNNTFYLIGFCYLYYTVRQNKEG